MTKLEKIDLALSKGKVQGARQLLKEYYQAEDKAAWDKTRYEEYEALYPSMRDMTDDEKAGYDEANFSDDNPKPDEFEYPQVTIDYITIDEDGSEVRAPEDYLTYTEWLNETKVITEAIEEELDEDGNIVTEEVAEVTEPVRPYVAVEITENRINSYEPLAIYLKEKAKTEKLKKLGAITVTTKAGNVFDGDDTARADMLSAIQASETLGQDTANWKLSDNTWAEIDLDEMREASALAIQAKGKILAT